MEQLTGGDNLFLHVENRHQHMHVAGIGIYDMATAPGGFVRFKDILRLFESRLHAVPVFRRRIKTVPLEIDLPYWMEDPDVDVEYHVRHIALPKPGDWRQLCIEVARIHSRPLDRARPLWEAYVIEGLEPIPGIPKDSFALYIKVHHAAVDGEAGADIVKAIHSFSPDEAVDESDRRVRIRDREPTTHELCARAVIHAFGKVPATARLSLRTAIRMTGLGAGYMGQWPPLRWEAGLPSVEAITSIVRRSPPTRFSRKVSAHRVLTMVSWSLAEMKRVSHAIEGATINDLFLTTVGGALNKYLGSKGELPDRSMTAMVPMTLRDSEEGSATGNQVGMSLRLIHSEIERPLERLAAIRSGAHQAKAMVSAIGEDLPKNVADLLPAAATELLTNRVVVPRMNIIVSNVRGPDVPMYLAGAKMVAFAPVSVAFNGMGLNVTGFSYHGKLWVSAVACREMMPDPGFFGECLETSFMDLVDAAGVLPVARNQRPTSPKKRVTPNRRSSDLPSTSNQAKAKRGSTCR
jgi:WS/DGAT/MGAT family acyltransferase